MALNVFICAGGRSTRFGGNIPKLFQDLGGKPVVDYVLDIAKHLTSLDRIYIVTSPNFLTWNGWPLGTHIVPQEPALGTGHAFQLAFEHFVNTQIGNVLDEEILVLMADCPLMELQDLTLFLQHETPLTLLAMYPEVFRRYGEILMSSSGEVFGIQEHKYTENPSWDTLPLCYTGIMKISSQLASSWVKALPFHSTVQEYHITDFVKMAHQHAVPVGVVISDSPQHFIGINTKEDWQAAYQLLQNRWRARAQQQGALFHDPSSVMLSWDTRFFLDAQVHPFNVFGPGVVVERGAVIFPFCRLIHTHIGPYARIGPFAHVKEGSNLGTESCVGSFVEMTRSSLGDYSQAKHLTYLGDVNIAQDVNVGAGVVMCNYDGLQKHTISIEKEAFIGAGTMLVAPVTIGSGATIGAGSVITEDVPEKTLSVSRAPQKNIVLSENSRHRTRPLKSKKLKNISSCEEK
ncbi:Bifunctional protein GlmU [Holospora curviuscula]|uniref:Bifunctional protein GlmU n=2 Tax=Holospora curviuscula TaxID=1082868 RepID=A0A2S5RE30_9PROT|nr:Bifunctional protein GlmU [Holospora curviuscula]